MKTDLLSRYVQNYFLTYMINQRGYGVNTVASYRDTFKLLFCFFNETPRVIANLSLVDLDKACILSFLQWLEDVRKNAVSTRNVRLAHIKSFFGYVLTVAPELMDHCSAIINIPFKKADKKPPTYLTENETKALLRAPDCSSRSGLRHMAILRVC